MEYNVAIGVGDYSSLQCRKDYWGNIEVSATANISESGGRCG